MVSIFKKEIKNLFSSLVGNIIIAFFLLCIGLYLFVNKDTSIFEIGYANLQPLFDIAPWFFLLVIPALCMRSFSEEKQLGTFEILQTRPLSSWQIVLGKFWAHAVLGLFIVFITTIYIFSLRALCNYEGLDNGGIYGSYLSLSLLVFLFTAISIWVSSLVKSNIAALFLSIFILLVLYYGFTALSKFSNIYGGADYLFESLGIDFHYRNMNTGLIDFSSVIYFISLTAFFIYLTHKQISKK